MSAQAKLIMAVALLIAVGGGMAGYKSSKLGVPFWEGDQVNEWLVESRVSFLATGRDVKARLALPSIAVESGSGQESGSLDYHYNVEADRGEYTAVWSSGAREDGQITFAFLIE